MSPYNDLVQRLRSSLGLLPSEANAILNAAERSLSDLVTDAIAGRCDTRKCECGGDLTVKSSWQVCDSQKQRCRCDTCGEFTYRSVPRSTIRARKRV